MLRYLQNVALKNEIIPFGGLSHSTAVCVSAVIFAWFIFALPGFWGGGQKCFSPANQDQIDSTSTPENWKTFCWHAPGDVFLSYPAFIACSATRIFAADAKPSFSQVALIVQRRCSGALAGSGVSPRQFPIHLHRGQRRPLLHTRFGEISPDILPTRSRMRAIELPLPNPPLVLPEATFPS